MMFCAAGQPAMHLKGLQGFCRVMHNRHVVLVQEDADVCMFGSMGRGMHPT